MNGDTCAGGRRGTGCVTDPWWVVRGSAKWRLAAIGLVVLSLGVVPLGAAATAGSDGGIATSTPDAASTTDAAPNASVTFRDQVISAGEDEVVVDSVELATGGFVAIHDGGPDGTVLANSSYLEPGSYSNVTVDLDGPVEGERTLVAVVHRDTDGNEQFGGFAHGEDGPYLHDGEPVSDEATVLGLTPTATPTDSPAEPATDPPDPTRTPSPTPESAPGFGPVAAFVAVIGSLLALGRRD